MADEPADEGMYDLAPGDAPARPPRRILNRGAPIGDDQNANAKPGAPIALAYRVDPNHSPSAGKSVADPATLKNVQIPLWLLGAGVVIEVLAAWWREPSLKAALNSVGRELVLGTVFMLAGILIAAKVRQIKLGSFWNAVFKLAAISVAPAAALEILAPFLRFIPFGGLLGWAGEFCLYFALLGLLFDLDESDTWYCVCVIFVVNIGVYFLFRFI